MVHPSGEVEQGTWVEGKMEGHRKYKSAEGRVLEGEFRDGKICNGAGVLTLPD
eukprot:gene24257-27440_t